MEKEIKFLELQKETRDFSFFFFFISNTEVILRGLTKLNIEIISRASFNTALDFSTCGSKEEGKIKK